MRNAVDAVSWPIRVAAAWSWRLLAIGVVVFYLMQVLFTISTVVFSLVIALLFAAVLHPLESRLRRLFGGRSSPSAALTLLCGLLVLVGIGWFVVSQINSHSSELATQLTNVVDRGKTWLHNGPLKLGDKDFNNLASKIRDTINSHQSDLVTGAIATLQTLADLAAGILLVVLATFFFLRDGDAIWGWALGLLPEPARSPVDRAALLGWVTLGGYMRGVLLIAMFHAVSVSIVLLVIHVQLFAALGVLIFLGSFIPLVGLTITGTFCVAVTLLEHGPTAAIVVAAAIIILLQLEGHFLQPLIMSRAVEVHPLAVAVTVLSGTILAGIAGALIAVPAMAFANTVVKGLRAEMNRTVGAGAGAGAGAGVGEGEAMAMGGGDAPAETAAADADERTLPGAADERTLPSADPKVRPEAGFE